MRSGCFWCVLCLVVLSVLPAIAQTQAGISGVIHDSTGAVIPGVTVTVTNPATNGVAAQRRSNRKKVAAVMAAETRMSPAHPPVR